MSYSSEHHSKHSHSSLYRSNPNKPVSKASKDAEANAEQDPKKPAQGIC